MGCGLYWSDVPELYDDKKVMQKCSLERVAELDFQLEEKQENSAPHVFIEGDNYPVLKLLSEKYSGKADIIYIDPPYNTGKTIYTYNDARFLDTESDRHSAWLSFMRRRLESAKILLSESGCIFIAIGQEELFHLKLLCDQIFGGENFINDFMWLHGKGKKDGWSRTMQQSNLCYAKNRKKLTPFCDFEKTDWAKTNPDNDGRGNWFSASISFDEKRSNPQHPFFYTITSPSGIKWTRQWLISRSEMDYLLSENKIYWGKAPEYANVPRRKVFNGEETKIIPKNIIDAADSTRSAQAHTDEMLGEKGAFDNPKPVNLIQRLIAMTQMKKDALVIDFFAGSGTTLESVVMQNDADKGSRRCILVQKPEPVKKPGSKYKNIAQLCYTRICRAAEKSGDSIIYYRLNAPAQIDSSAG